MDTVAIVPEAPLVWFDNFQVQGYAVRGTRRLSFVIIPIAPTATCAAIAGRWSLLAIETSEGAKSVGELFDDHSHKEVGSYADLADAKAAGAEYLTDWEARIRASEPCPCAEIPP